MENNIKPNSDCISNLKITDNIVTNIKINNSYITKCLDSIPFTFFRTTINNTAVYVIQWSLSSRDFIKNNIDLEKLFSETFTVLTFELSCKEMEIYKIDMPVSQISWSPILDLIEYEKYMTHITIELLVKF